MLPYVLNVSRKTLVNKVHLGPLDFYFEKRITGKHTEINIWFVSKIVLVNKEILAQSGLSIDFNITYVYIYTSIK